MSTATVTGRSAYTARSGARTARPAARTARASARTAERPSRSGTRAERRERSLFGVPERFMGPRLVLVTCVLLLVGFGLLMVYSASSVTALSETGDAAYYLKRQLALGAVGAVGAVALARLDYHIWTGGLGLSVLWVVTVLLLLATKFLGTDNGMGADRWIEIAGFQFQPSEFAKLLVILTAASICQKYFEEGSIDWNGFLKALVAFVVVPIFLIVIQPDKGTVMILGVTLLAMGYLAGVPTRYLLGLLVLCALGFFALSMSDDYSRQRLITMLNPWSDRYGTGWQLVQGFYAFGTGGLTGVGIGMSRQKYSYLPMAHNDFIFAIIGEECGLLGTLGLLAGFAVFAWAGFRIARYAPDLAGRLVAAGCTTMVIVQLLLNVAGVLGLFPLSGKPIPFISYGGTSLMANMLLVGLVVSVSVHSRLPQTVHDSARASWRLSGEEGAGAPRTRGAARGLTFVDEVGEPQPRSARRGAEEPADAGRPAFTVVDGGRSTRTSSTRPGVPERASGRAGTRATASSRARRSTDAGGRTRIDLGPDAADRLRSRDSGPRTR